MDNIDEDIENGNWKQAKSTQNFLNITVV